MSVASIQAEWRVRRLAAEYETAKSLTIQAKNDLDNFKPERPMANPKSLAAADDQLTKKALTKLYNDAKEMERLAKNRYEGAENKLITILAQEGKSELDAKKRIQQISSKTYNPNQLTKRALGKDLQTRATNFIDNLLGSTNYVESKSNLNQQILEKKQAAESLSAGSERYKIKKELRLLERQLEELNNQYKQTVITTKDIRKAFQSSVKNIYEEARILNNFTGGMQGWWDAAKLIWSDSHKFQTNKWLATIDIIEHGFKTLWKTSEEYFYTSMKDFGRTLLGIFSPITNLIKFTIGAVAGSIAGIKRLLGIQKEEKLSPESKRLDQLITLTRRMAGIQDEALDIQRDDWKAKLRAMGTKVKDAASSGWGWFAGLGTLAFVWLKKKIIDGAKGIWNGIKGAFNLIKSIISRGSKVLVDGAKTGAKTFGKIGSMFKFGLSKLLLPIMIVMSIFDFVEGWSKTKGNIFQKFVGGLESVVLGIVEWPIKFFGAIVDWLAKQMGFENLNVADKLIGGIKSIFDFIKNPIDSVKKFFGIKSDNDSGIAGAKSTAENAYKFDRQKDREQMRELTKTTKEAGADSANAVANAVAIGSKGSSGGSSNNRSNEANVPSHPELLTGALGGMAF